MVTGLRLCLLPNVGNPRRTIKRVATVCQPHRTICVLCVHLLTSALNPFLCRGVTGLATRAETIAASRSIIGRGVDLRRQ